MKFSGNALLLLCTLSRNALVEAAPPTCCCSYDGGVSCEDQHDKKCTKDGGTCKSDGTTTTTTTTTTTSNGGGTPPPTNNISIFGVWHCHDDYCIWGNTSNMDQFDIDNRWIIDRYYDSTQGPCDTSTSPCSSSSCDPSIINSCTPSVNLVVLSFLQPMKLLNDGPVAGLQPGMTQEVVNYFKNQGVRVQISIGGITYTDFWTEALTQNATQLGLNAAQVATDLGVGIEIDYEESTDPDLVGLEAFINAYRSVHQYNSTGIDHAARLTIDVAAGDRYLIGINRKATGDWLNPANPILDYANAMVAARPYNKASDATGWWQEHVDGKPQYNPPVPPLPPAKFTGAMYLSSMHGLANCNAYFDSIQYGVWDEGQLNYVETVAPNGAGTTSGMLGLMFWAAGCPNNKKLCTTPDDGYTCELGLGVAASQMNIPVPMPELRQE